MSTSDDMNFKRPETMEELFNDDPFGLLSDVGEKKASMSFSDKVMSAFEEVAKFIKEHRRLPSAKTEKFEEELLAISYQELIKTNPEGQGYCESLLPDELKPKKVERIQRSTLTRDETIRKHVLDMQSRSFNSITDVMADDPFGLLSDESEDVFPIHEEWRDTEEYKKKRMVIEEPVAVAKKCLEFHKFSGYFETVKQLQARGHVKAEKVVGGVDINVLPGQFFIIDGVLSLIVEGSIDGNTYKKSTGKRRYRVRQIFDNGTESRPFNTSVKASFYKSDPPCVRLVPADDVGTEFFQDMTAQLDPLYNSIENKGKPDGYVYILGTLSNNPVIREFVQSSSLIKIGYTDRTVEERIADAEKSATYLFAPVEVLAKIECYNFDANKLEEALHTVFAVHRLNVTLQDNQGGFYRPEEWFTVSVDTACEVVDHIMSNDLHLYYIDPIQGKLKLRR